MLASSLRKRLSLLTGICAVVLLQDLALPLHGQVAINGEPVAPNSNARQQLESLARQASERFRVGDASGAIKLEKEALHVAEQSFGQYSLEASQVCMNLAVLLRATSQFKDAIAWMLQAADNYEQRKDIQCTAYGLTLQVLGETYLTTGENRLALQNFERVYPILSANLKEKEPALITAVHDLGVGCFEVGRLEDAEKYLLKALLLRKEVIGEDSVPVAYTADHLGKVYNLRREYEKAEPYLEDADRIFSQHEAEVPDVAGRSCFSLAQTYYKTGRFSKAEEALHKGEAIFTKFSAKCSYANNELYRCIAEFRTTQGRLPEAETALLKSLELAEKFNAQGSGVATSCFGLALFYRDAGMAARAEDYFLRAQKISILASGENSLQSLSALRYLADLYYGYRHDPEKSLPYAKKASELGQKLYGKKNFMDELMYAAAASQLGDRELEQEILKSALAQAERDGVTDTARYNLARLKLAQLNGEKLDVIINGTIEAQLQRLREVERADSKDPKTETAKLAALKEVGRTYLIGSRPKEARQYLERAFPLALEHSTAFSDLYQDALELLAYARVDMNELEEPALMEKWLAGRMARVDLMFSMTQDADRQQWADREWSFDLPCSLGDAAMAALISLRTKNIVLDYNQECRRLGRAALLPEGNALWDKYVELNARYRTILPSSPSQEELARAREARDAATAELATLTHTRLKVRENLSLTPGQLQSALPQDAALLDYVAYSHRARGGNYEMRYGIIIHRKGRAPQFVDADSTQSQLDYMVRLFRHAMESPGKNPKEKNEGLAELLKAAGDILLGPVLPQLEGVKTLIISPDWELQTLPFAVLLDKQGRFMAERFRIQYVNSARDLLPPMKVPAPTPQGSIGIFAGATYDLHIPAVNLQQLTSFQRSRALDLLADRSGLTFAAPPGSARELSLIGDVAREAGWTVASFSGGEATELNLRDRGASSRVLHVATLGYSFPAPSGKVWQDTRRIHREPSHSGRQVNMDMDRHGVLFSGAQDSVSFWQSGYCMPEKNDGFLTAEEVEFLNLSNTQLVVLSACNSGIGEATPNGGVFDLRSAFLGAGAQNVISTLWPIPDVETAEFMADFYKRLFASNRVGASWFEAQRDWLVKARKDKGLWMAIKQAGGFILGSSGWEN